MPEKETHFSHGGYISADGIKWEPLGHIDEFSVTSSMASDDEMQKWADTLLELQNATVGTITFKVPWWQSYSKAFAEVLGCSWSMRSRYTVPMLRRNGKSHKKS